MWKWKNFLFVIMFVFCMLSAPMVTYADSVTINNDGMAKDNPYGDSGINKSFADAEYYDCYIPYNLTPNDIGGYATGARWAAYSQYDAPMAESTRYRKVTGFINYENNLLGNNRVLSRAFQGMQQGYEDSTGMSVVTDANGTQYYISAFPGFLFYNSTSGTNGFASYSSEAWGTAVDVILTNGEVIHFAMGDSIAPQHSNGGIENPAYFDVIYENAPMILSQYKHLFQAQAGQTIEVWGRSGCNRGFMEKYNIGTGEDQNRVAIMRVYNIKVSSNPRRSSGVREGLSYSLGDVRISSGSNSTVGLDSMGNEIVSEWDLTGMPQKDVLSAKQKQILLPSRSNLGVGESYSAAKIGESVALQKKVLTYDNARVVIVFVGLCMVFYAVFLLLAMIFDKANSFIDISLVSLVTAGKLLYSDDETAKGVKGYISTKRVCVVSAVIMIIGLLTLSGGVLPFMMSLVYSCLSDFL